eukprot:m51a1_g5556 hypothetical protein (387) ;mRNA; f:557274-558704
MEKPASAGDIESAIERKVKKEDVREIALLGESMRVELKEDMSNTDSIAAAISSFANSTSGGVIIVGIGDKDRSLVGVPLPEVAGLFRTIQSLAHTNCEPGVEGIVLTYLKTSETHCVILVRVPCSPARPHKCKGVYYIRTLSGKRDATIQELVGILSQTVELQYIIDPPSELVAFLEAWQLKQVDSLGLTIAGDVVLSASKGKMSEVRLMRFATDDISGDVVDDKTIREPLVTLTRMSLEWVRISVVESRSAAAEDALFREITGGIPYDAVREVLTNAIAHRDYETDSNVRVLVTPKRVVVRSPGLPVNGDMAIVSRGMHMPRNPAIYQVMTAFKLVANSGLGLVRAKRALAERGLPPPLVEAVRAEPGDIGEVVVTLFAQQTSAV